LRQAGAKAVDAQRIFLLLVSVQGLGRLGCRPGIQLTPLSAKIQQRHSQTARRLNQIDIQNEYLPRAGKRAACAHAAPPGCTMRA